MQLDEILERQQQSWQDGIPVSIENLLSSMPELQNRPDAIVDLVYAEVLIREKLGQHPSCEEYTSRFPDAQKSIARQFQIHRALKLSEQADVPTDVPDATVADGVADPALASVATRRRLPSIEGFELHEMLGHGGSGVAWRARDTKLDRIVAIKFLLDLDRDLKREGNLKDERLLREASAAAQLLHPSIVQVFQIGESEGVPFLVMEYVEGGSLAQKLRSGPLPPKQGVALSIAIADAISHAHENGVIHRDIKPGNILLNRADRPQVCDFGLARQLDAEHSLHQTGAVLGTPAYMPPEQANGLRGDGRSDVYSIGAVLYEMLCGRSPFQAAHPWEILYQVVTLDPLPLRQLNPSLPAELETICQKCLEKSPERRYQTASELGADLKRFSEGKPIHARPVGMIGKFSKWCLRNRAVAVLVVVSFLSLLTLAIGSTVAAIQLTAFNEQVIQEKKAASDAEAKAINDRTVAVESMYDLINAVYDELVADALPLDTQEDIANAVVVGLRNITAIDDDPASLQTAILAKKRIGEIQALRGHTQLATLEFEEALAMSRELLDAAPDDFDRKYELAKMLNYFVLHLNRMGEFEDATPLLTESNFLLDELLLEQPDNSNVLKRWVVARSYEIDQLRASKPPQESIDLGMECLDNVQTLYEKSRDYDEGMRVVNQFYIRLGRAYLDASQLSEAEKYLKLGISVAAEAIGNSPDSIMLKSAMAVTEKMYGMLLTQQARFNEAIETFGSAIEKAEFAESLDPDNMIRKVETANIRGLRAPAFDAVGRHEEAVEDLEYAISVYEEKIVLAPDDIGNYRTLMGFLQSMVDSLNRLHRVADSRKTAQRIRAVLDSNEALIQPSDQFHGWFADISINMANVVDGKSLRDPTAEDRALGLFSIAYVFSKDEMGETFDEKSILLIRELEPDSTFDTVGELFQYGRQLPVTHPVVAALFPLLEARIYARQAELISRLDDMSEADKLRMEDLKERAIKLLIQLVKSNPALLSQIYLEPDLIWLRRTELFAESGLTLEGADR